MLAGQLEVLQVESVRATGCGCGGGAGLAVCRVPAVFHQLSVIEINMEFEWSVMG